MSDIDLIRHRVQGRVDRARRALDFSVSEVERLSSGLGPDMFVSQAENLAAASSALARHLTELNSLEAVLVLLEDS